MSGILDSKSRIIDAILTVEGRRQMAAGTFEVSFATFSDYGVSYIPDAENGHEDPTGKIYLEACNLPHDQITFEANDEGRINGFRNHDLKVETQGGNIPASVSQASLVNGKLTAYKFHHGRRIRVFSIKEDRSDNNKGFIYSDTAGLTGSVLIDSTLPARTISATAPSPGAPFIAYVGTMGGMGPVEFVTSISSSLSKLRSFGGPSITFTTYNDSIYLDSGQSFVGSTIFTTGTLSSPLQIEEAAIGGKLLTDEIENASFSSQIQGILTSSFDNFLEHQTISSINRLFEDDQFDLSTNELTFDITKNSDSTLRALKQSPPSLNAIDSIFSDDKLSHLENFMYLPPIVKTSDAVLPDKSNVNSLTPYLLGDYPSWGDNEKSLTFNKLMLQLKQFQDIKNPIYFEKTSAANNIIGQLFEVTDTTVSKLDVVDFGPISNDAQEPSVVTDRVFFAGKTFLDNRGTTCYVNMFTLIFSKDSRNVT